MTGGVAADYCGQQQPHAAHLWEVPAPYGSTGLSARRQCAGLIDRQGGAAVQAPSPVACTCGNPLGPHQPSCEPEARVPHDRHGLGSSA